MHAATAKAAPPIWGEPRGPWGGAALIAMAALNKMQNRAALALLNPRPGDHVLELGCGPGAAMKEALSRVGEHGYVAGIDHAQTAACIASRALHKEAICGRAAVLRASVDDLPFRDLMFDRAFAVNSFSFWPHPGRALHEIARVLRPGGRLVITERAASPDCPTSLVADDGFARLDRAARLLRAGGWTLLDERADKDGPSLLALSVLARRPD